MLCKLIYYLLGTALILLRGLKTLRTRSDLRLTDPTSSSNLNLILLNEKDML